MNQFFYKLILFKTKKKNKINIKVYSTFLSNLYTPPTNNDKNKKKYQQIFFFYTYTYWNVLLYFQSTFKNLSMSCAILSVIYMNIIFYFSYGIYVLELEHIQRILFLSYDFIFYLQCVYEKLLQFPSIYSFHFWIS